MRKFSRKALCISILAMACSLSQTVYALDPYSEFILPQSDTVLLTDQDLAGLSPQELNYARNELYARHGRRFNSSELTSYFESKSWYVGRISPDSFTELLCGHIVDENAKLIVKHETALGSQKYEVDKQNPNPIETYTLPRFKDGVPEADKWYQSESDAIKAYWSYVSSPVAIPVSDQENYHGTHVYFMDMNQDSVPEMLLYCINNYEYHWKLYTYRNETVEEIAQSDITKMGNAGHALGVIDDSILYDTSDKFLESYDHKIESFYVMEGNEIHRYSKEYGNIIDSNQNNSITNLKMVFQKDNSDISESTYNQITQPWYGGSITYASDWNYPLEY